MVGRMLKQLGVQRVVEDLRVELFRRRISQETLAASTGMSQSKISRRLKGDVDPTLPELQALAAAAGLHLQITLIDPQTAGASASTSPSDAPAPSTAEVAS